MFFSLAQKTGGWGQPQHQQQNRKNQIICQHTPNHCCYGACDSRTPQTERQKRGAESARCVVGTSQRCLPRLVFAFLPLPTANDCPTSLIIIVHHSPQPRTCCQGRHTARQKVAAPEEESTRPPPPHNNKLLCVPLSEWATAGAGF